MRRGPFTIGVVGLALAGLAGALLVGTTHAGALQACRGAAFAAYQVGNVLIGLRHAWVEERRAIEACAGTSEVQRLGAGGYLLHVPPGHVLRAVAALRAEPGVPPLPAAEEASRTCPCNQRRTSGRLTRI